MRDALWRGPPAADRQVLLFKVQRLPDLQFRILGLGFKAWAFKKASSL